METESEKLISNGIAIGEKRGEEKGICSFVELCQELGLSQEDTRQKLEMKFGLQKNTADDKVTKYWKMA